MGDQLRFTPEGPRPLNDADFRLDGKEKVIRNPAPIVFKASHFEPIVDPTKHARLIETLDKRAGSQKGKPHFRDPQHNPLANRIYDLDCAWPLYCKTYGKSFKYSCGLYMQSHGQACNHNSVDGVQAASFALSCIQQRLLTPGYMPKLHAKLRELAAAERKVSSSGSQLKGLQARLVKLHVEKATIEKNMARAKNDRQFEAMAKQFDELEREEVKCQQELAKTRSTSSKQDDPQKEVTAALALLDRLPEPASKSDNLGAIGGALALVNLRMFLAFEKRQVKKRQLNKVAYGVVTLGNAPPPVPLYSGPTGRRELKNAAALAAGLGGQLPLPDPVSGREGNSLGNVSRGDRTPIELFVGGVQEMLGALSIATETLAHISEELGNACDSQSIRT